MLPDIDKLAKQAMSTATQLINIGKHKEAEMVLNQLLKVSPTREVRNLLGLSLMNHGEYQAALEQFQLILEEDNPESHNNLALALVEIGRSDEAIRHYHKALKLDPNNPIYHNNLGLELRIRGQLDDALKCFEQSLNIQNDKFTQLNYGSTLLEKKRLTEALDSFEAAVHLDPNFAAAHISVAYCLFLMGDWANGWAEYEYRFNHYPMAKLYRQVYPLDGQWDGMENLSGKKIILYGEQGVGDIIHFVRYAKLLKEEGAYIILHCPPGLNSLMMQQGYIDDTLNVNQIDSPLPLHDFHASLLSLPHLLRHPRVPDCPYLKVERKGQGMKQYDKYFKVGIVWAGNAEHPHDNKRSCHLKYFQPLHDLEGVKLFSFQWDLRLRKYHRSDKVVDFAEGADQLKAVHLGYHIQDWSDTAALLQEMNFIVSVDTAVLHLAGALNVPAAGLLSYVPDWRWMTEGDSTIWYKSMKLFRQEKAGDWESVLKDVAEYVRTKKPTE
jgi:Flp pilus assembly protein TadD